jgi:hypothetical protein
MSQEENPVGVGEELARTFAKMNANSSVRKQLGEAISTAKIANAFAPGLREATCRDAAPERAHPP